MPDDLIGVDMNDIKWMEPYNVDLPGDGMIIGGYSVGKIIGEPVEDIIVETNHGPQPASLCRPMCHIPINNDGTFGPTTIIYGNRKYNQDEWHAVRDKLGFPHEVGHHVKIVGRPYGDLPEMDFKLAGCAELGSEIKIRKLMGNGDVELDDGFYYPHESYR